ncbi:MAG: hypothetical protein IPL55_08200 [Saprospiraceae bacterium]|nr:hypothetical protein [Saprospiraceae bacterium]
MIKSENSESDVQQELSWQPDTVIVSSQETFNPQGYLAIQAILVVPTGYRADALFVLVKSLVTIGLLKHFDENIGDGIETLAKQELLILAPL